MPPSKLLKLRWSRILSRSLWLSVLGLEAARWAGFIVLDRPAWALPPLFLLLGLWMMVRIWEGYHSGKEEDIGNVVLLAMGLMF